MRHRVEGRSEAVPWNNNGEQSDPNVRCTLVHVGPTMEGALTGMIDWSKSCNSSIEYSKLALINFSHHGVKKAHPSLTLQDITIEPIASTKYLGIVLDQHLN